MARVRYTPEMVDWLAQAYRVSHIPELTRRFNGRWGTDLSERQIRSAVKNYRLRSGRAPGYRKGELPQGHGARTYTDAEIAWLREWYPRVDRDELARRFAERFGRRVSARNLAQRCQAYEIRAGRSGQFAPGQQPWNKGLSGYQAGGNSPRTRFRPGSSPHTTVPVGSYVQDKGGLWMLKVSDRDPARGDAANSRLRDWRYLHRLTWEAAHGPIPAGHCVILLTGDPDDCLHAQRLACVSRAELARLNQSGFSELPADVALRRAAVANVKLLSDAHERARALGLGPSERRRLLPSAGGNFPPGDPAAAARLAASHLQPGADPRRAHRRATQET